MERRDDDGVRADHYVIFDYDLVAGLLWSSDRQGDVLPDLDSFSDLHVVVDHDAEPVMAEVEIVADLGAGCERIVV